MINPDLMVKLAGDENVWHFDESALDACLRDWAWDLRHTDASEQAARDRLQLVQSFLYSKQARQKKLFRGHSGRSGQ